MKTYPASASCSWAKVLALVCATNVLLLRGIDAACSDLVSPGDLGVGICAFDDPSCKNGGLGCFEDGACRYCKTKDTIQASHFVPCPTNTPAPTPTTKASVPVAPAPVSPPSAPVPAPTGSCAATVSPGDQGVGISAVVDLTCKNGGLGCFADGACRYCKTKDTIQAGHFLACSSFAAPAPATQAPATQAPVTPAPTTQTPMTSEPTPEGPAGDTLSVAQCSEKISPGDFAAGVNVFTDETCSTNPDVGCFKSICRFCKMRDTDASKDFVPCPVTAASAPSTMPPAMTAPPATTTPPVLTTPATTSPPGSDASATTAPPTLSPTPAYTSKYCATTVAPGDAAVGINVITDSTCEKSPSIGCFKDVCRFCKVRSTIQSQAFIDCPADAIPAGPAATATPKTDSPATTTIAPASTTSTPVTGTPGATTVTPVGTTAVPLPAPLDGQVIPQKCARSVSSGDALQGIEFVNDATCGTAGGVGCVESYCRFCKTTDTPASQHFLPCASFATIPVNAKTPAANICSGSIQPAQALSGIWTNVVCQEWYRDACLRSMCPLCKFADTTASSGLPVCVAPPTAPAIPAALPGAPVPNMCTEAILEEVQPSVGIWATWDDTCTMAQSDCVSKCRFCKYADTAQSSALMACSSIPPRPPPPKYVAPAADTTRPPPPTANECSKSLTTDEISVGVWRNAQCYTTDASGSCTTVVCSPCSYYDTETSFKYPDCVNGIFPYWSTPPPELVLARGGVSMIRSNSGVSVGKLSAFEVAIAVAAAVGVTTLFVAAVYSARQAMRYTNRPISLSAASRTNPGTPSILSIVTSDEGGMRGPPETPQPSMRPRKVRAPRTPVMV